jgi:signal transduction histidine kinase
MFCRIKLVVLLLFLSVKGFSLVNRPGIDSLKNLVASSLKNDSNPDTLYINRLNSLAAYYFESNTDSTLYYTQKSIELSGKIHYKSGLATGLAQKARVNYTKGKYSDAKNDFDRAAELYSDLKDYRGLSKVFLYYGGMYDVRGDYKLALTYLNKALVLSKLVKDEKATSRIYINLGNVYADQDSLSTSLDYYFRSLDIAVKIHDKALMATNYNNIGVNLQSIEVYPKALEYFKKSLELTSSRQNASLIGLLNGNIGEVMMAQHKYDEAFPYLLRAMMTAKWLDNKDRIISAYQDLGTCFANKKEYEVAYRYMDTSLAIATRYHIDHDITYANIGLASIFNMQHNYKRAYPFAIEAKKLANATGLRSARADADLELNKTLAGLGKFDPAFKTLKEYTELKDSLKNNGSIQKLTSYNLELNFATRQRQLAQQQKERDVLYRQRIKQQRLINAVFFSIIVGMIAISVVYYKQKRKQQRVNTLLADKNAEVLKQKTDIDSQAQKLNELNVLKDRLISVLAHDLRAPLSTLRGLFSLLQDDSITHDQMLEMIPNVLKKLEYTSDFLDTLLFWINSQMDNFENSTKNFYLKDIVLFEMENYHEQAAVKGIKLIDNVPGNLLASADPNSIRIVIRNLITNAIKFSKESDTIEISATLQDDHRHVITVKDTGVGMSSEQLNKLFKSKVNSITGTNNESGTGMGMLFCKDLVEKCSGRIWVNSSPGMGTAFSFTVPAGGMNELQLEVA